MSQFFTSIPKKSFDRGLIIVMGIILIVSTFLRDPIYSFDTYSYLRADITRFPGYILFIRSFEWVFGTFFDRIAVGFQLLIGLLAIWIVFKNSSKLFGLSVISKTILLLILVYPYFPPLDVALNLSSEGLSYPFYLLMIHFILNFLFKEQLSAWIPFGLAFLLLCLTRGQFIVVAPILIFLVILKFRSSGQWRKIAPILIALLLLPVAAQLLDSSYRKVIHGFFKTTPYSYVNAITLPLYVSQESDAEHIKTYNEKEIFLHSFHHIDSMGLTNAKAGDELQEKYLLFHNNFPKICNQNIHEYGLNYYKENGRVPPANAFAIEESCKQLFPILIRSNFKEWLSLVFAGIFYGFGSFILFLIVIGMALWALIKTWKKFTMKHGFILMTTLLFLSNALVVAVASHSISRYLFYNYFLGALIIMILLKKNNPQHET